MPGSQPQRHPNCHGFQCVCKFSRVFDHVKPPKNARIASKSPKKEYWGLTRCHGNSILDINIPFRVSHRPCFYSILMKFEANWVKVRWWIQSILKITHFLLPVGGAITLPHNCHIDAIGFIHRTNHWIVIKIRQCMWTLLDTSCLSILAITSSPRHGQTVWDIKNPSAI